MATTQRRLIIVAAVLWVFWLLLAWVTGTWKDQTDAGRTQFILWSALAQMLFWVGLVFVAWAVGVSVIRDVARVTSTE